MPPSPKPLGTRTLLALAVALASPSGIAHARANVPDQTPGPQTAASQPTQAQPTQERVRGGMFDASDPKAIEAFMIQQGYKAALRPDADGDPLIRGRISRTDYAIQFYECEAGRFCNSVQFVAEGPAIDPKDFERVNAFNIRWRYVRATLSGDSVRLQMDLNLDAGVTAANLEDTLDIWRQLVEVFERDLLPPPRTF